MNAAVPLLRLEQVEVVYQKVITAIHGVSLEVPTGQIVVLLGSNGAGKTTTLRAVTGFLGSDDAKVTDGKIWFEAHAIENSPPHLVAARGIALVPERRKVFETLTVLENLQAAVPSRIRSRAAQRERIEQVFDQFPRLAPARGRLAGYLSGGERQMLAMGSALISAPRLLLVDEMSLGLAPRIVEELLERLVLLKKALGLTVLLVEQSAHLALQVADYGYIMENGRVVLDGTAERLRAHGDVQEFYLGMGSGPDRRSYRDVKQYRRSRRWFG
jgi:branched-chain amino acid transport system ATP-binding protein